MLKLLKTLQRTDKINAIKIEPGAVAVDAIRIEGVADYRIFGFFVGFHAVALHQTLGRIHLDEAVGVDFFSVAIPVDGVCKGVLAFCVVLDMYIAEGKPLLLPCDSVMTGAVGIYLRLEQTVGRIYQHFEIPAVQFVCVLFAFGILIFEALHASGAHVISEVVPLVAACDHSFHRLHRNHGEVDGRIINIGAFARGKGTDESNYYENNSFQLLERTNCCAFTHT